MGAFKHPLGQLIGEPMHHTRDNTLLLSPVVVPPEAE